MGNKFPVPGGGCLRSEAVANTASIYSAFLMQVGMDRYTSTFRPLVVSVCDRRSWDRILLDGTASLWHSINTTKQSAESLGRWAWCACCLKSLLA